MTQTTRTWRIREILLRRRVGECARPEINRCELNLFAATRAVNPRGARSVRDASLNRGNDDSPGSTVALGNRRSIAGDLVPGFLLL